MQKELGIGFGSDLAEVGRELSAWRSVHGGPGRRLPSEIWDAVVRLATVGDPGPVARALRLNPDSLARRMASGNSRRTGVRARRPEFVELKAVPQPPVQGGCRVEVTAADGSRLSIHLSDPASVDLVALAGGLLRGGR
jgi:hypothetical protein